MFVIVTEFAFFQMEQESFSGNAVEFSQSSLAKLQKFSMPLIWVPFLSEYSLE